MEYILYCEPTNANFKRITGISKKDIKDKYQYQIEKFDEFKLKNSYFINWLSLTFSEVGKYKAADLSDIRIIFFDVLSIEEKSVKIKITIITGNIEQQEEEKSNIKQLCLKHGINYGSFNRNIQKIPGEYVPKASGGVEYVVLEKDFLFFIQCQKITKGDKSLISLFPSQK